MHRINTRGAIHRVISETPTPPEILLLALPYIPQPEMVTNKGAAIPPNEAAIKAAGCPTVTPLGGTIAAV
tara:strand:- start:298 stop:507 length:210 start_codon:yes stop_codon:yes gene_type:complete